MLKKLITKSELIQLGEVDKKKALQDLENLLNSALSNFSQLNEYQEALYSQMDALNKAGFNIGRWDYNCEKEVWGGPSYMDKSKDDELIVKSWFGKGIKIDWNNYNFWKEFDEA
jgi:hypothetical protein